MTTYLGLKSVVAVKPTISFKKTTTVDTAKDESPCFLSSSRGGAISQRLRLGLADIRKLKNDWDTYGAKAPTEDTINKAYEVLDVIPFLKAPEILPEKDGSIGLYWDEPSITRVIKINSSTFPIVQYKEESEYEEKNFTYELSQILNFIYRQVSSRI